MVFSNSARITIDLDCGNTPMQKDEQERLGYELTLLFQGMGMHLKKVVIEA